MEDLVFNYTYGAISALSPFSGTLQNIVVENMLVEFANSALNFNIKPNSFAKFIDITVSALQNAVIIYIIYITK